MHSVLHIKVLSTYRRLSNILQGTVSIYQIILKCCDLSDPHIVTYVGLLAALV